MRRRAIDHLNAILGGNKISIGRRKEIRAWPILWRRDAAIWRRFAPLDLSHANCVAFFCGNSSASAPSALIEGRLFHRALTLPKNLRIPSE